MTYRIGDIELDPRTREVRQDGRPVPVEPKVLDLILYLLEHRDRVVTKQELLDVLWEGRAVGDSVMARAVHAARRLLRNPQAIKT
jgi:DNA-binding winged helix-turn-helix (wHTH) protein